MSSGKIFDRELVQLGAISQKRTLTDEELQQIIRVIERTETVVVLALWNCIADITRSELNSAVANVRALGCVVGERLMTLNAAVGQLDEVARRENDMRVCAEILAIKEELQIEIDRVSAETPPT